MLDNSLSNKERQISHLKIIIAVVILVALGTVIGLNYKPIKTYVKETGQGVLEYAKHADPFTTGCILGLVGVADSSFLSLPEGNDFLIVYFSFADLLTQSYRLFHVRFLRNLFERRTEIKNFDNIR